MEANDGAPVDKRYCEEFEPFCKWQREEGRDILEVHLSGFKKEQMKVQISQLGVMKITGERPLVQDQNKWSRFSKEINISRDVKTNEIHAKFSAGILYITMPKKTPVVPTQGPLQQTAKNGKPKPETNQDRGTKDSPTETSNATGDVAKGGTTKPAVGVRSSVFGLNIGKETAMKAAAAAIVAVLVGMGTYWICKYGDLCSRVEDDDH